MLCCALTTLFLTSVFPLDVSSQTVLVVQTCGTMPATPAVGSANGPITIDVNGRLCSNSVGTQQGVYIAPTAAAANGITPVVGGSAVSSQVLKATPGNLYSVYAVCTAACWLQVFNSTSAPSNGATTAGVASGNMVECVPITAGSIGGVNYLPGPPGVYTVGITAMISSTNCGTLTASTVGFIHGLIQ